MERLNKAKPQHNVRRFSRQHVACQTDNYLSRDDDVIMHGEIDTSGKRTGTCELSPLQQALADYASSQQHLQPPLHGGGQPPPPHKVQQSTNTVPLGSGVLEPSTSATACSKGKVDENTLRVTINAFSKMIDTLCSEPKKIGDVPWRIMVMPKQHMVQKKSQKCMGFFLQCCPDTTFADLVFYPSEAWSCHATAEMRLISERPSVQNFVRKTTHVYTAKENDWGYSCFMTWADVLDEAQGYIKNDQVTLEISVKADAPKNMMTREEFRKTLDQWYHLAEIQMNRNQVDLALEANSHAIKYCKDKDDEYKEKLEAQKEVLVGKKLLESITRIELETDPSRPKPEGETGNNTLRAALVGAQKSVIGTKVNEKRHVNGTAKKERRGAAVTKNLRKKVEANRNDKQLAAAQRKTEENRTPPSDESAKKEDAVAPPNTPTVEGGKSANISPFTTKTEEEEFVAKAEAQIKTGRDQLAKQHQQQSEETQQEDVVEGTCSEGTVDSSSEYGEEMGGLSMTECAAQAGEDHQSTSSGEDGDDADEEEDADDEEDIDVQEGEESAQVVETAESCSQTEEQSSNKLRPLAAVPTAKQRLQQPHQQMTSTGDAATIYLPPGDGSADALSQAASLPDISVPWLDYSRLPEVMLASLKPASSPHHLNTAYNFAMADGTLPVGQGYQEAMSELVSLGMSCLNAQRFLGRAEELFQKLEAIVELEVVREALKKVFHAKQYSGTGSKPRNAASKTSFGTFANAVASIAPNSFMKEILSVSSPCFSTDGEDDEEEDEDGSGDKVKRKRKGDEGVAQEGNEEETLQLLRTLFGRELLAYNHQMSGQLERLDEIVSMVEMIRVALESKEARKLLEVSKKLEQKISELELKLKKTEADLNRERNSKKIAENERAAMSEKAEEEKARVDSIMQVLKEKRNEIKKHEKRQTKDENRIAELTSENVELEEKNKNLKKDIETLKKKSIEERNKARKDQEKLQETIRRLETEALEKEAERERERAAAEERMRDYKHKEQAAFKERKHLQSTIQSLTERAKKSEIAQVEIELSSGVKLLERARDDAGRNESNMEEVIRKCTALPQARQEMEDARHKQGEWRAVKEEVIELIQKAKTEATGIIEAIRSGSKTLNQLPKLQVPKPPPGPSAVKAFSQSLLDCSPSILSPGAKPSVESTPPSAAPSVGLRLLPASAAPIGHPQHPSGSNIVGQLCGNMKVGALGSSPTPRAPPNSVSTIAPLAAGVIGQQRPASATLNAQQQSNAGVVAASLQPYMMDSPTRRTHNAPSMLPGNAYSRAPSPPTYTAPMQDSPASSLLQNKLGPIGVRPSNHNTKPGENAGNSLAAMAAFPRDGDPTPLSIWNWASPVENLNQVMNTANHNARFGPIGQPSTTQSAAPSPANVARPSAAYAHYESAMNNELMQQLNHEYSNRNDYPSMAARHIQEQRERGATSVPPPGWNPAWNQVPPLPGPHNQSAPGAQQQQQQQNGSSHSLYKFAS